MVFTFRMVGLLLAIASGAVACDRDPTPPLVQIVDVTPREAEVGDHIAIAGSGFPRGRLAHVAFRGTLYRAGQRPIADVVIRSDGLVMGGDRVDVRFTDELQNMFCRSEDGALHTTFEGDVEVSFDSAPGMLPVFGLLHRVSLDVRPPGIRAPADQAEGDRTLAHIGIAIEGNLSAAGGLIVSAVQADSPADQSGIRVGDLLTQFDHVRVHSKADVVPSGASSVVEVLARRGESPQEQLHTVSLAGLTLPTPRDYTGAVVAVMIASMLFFLWIAPPVTRLTWIERRRVSRPPVPFRLLPFVRTIGWLRLSIAVLCSILFALIPYGPRLLSIDPDVAIFFIMTTTALCVVGLLTGGWESAHPFSLRRTLRGVGQVATFALPATVAVASIVVLAGSAHAREIVGIQGAMPWQWNVFRNPATVVMFVAYFVLVLPGLDDRFSALPDAQDEGMGRGSSMPREARTRLFVLIEQVHLFLVCAIATIVFLGGWQVPGFSQTQLEGRGGLELFGALGFVVKIWALMGGALKVRRTVPRLRAGHLAALCWKWLIPLSLVAATIALAWRFWDPEYAVAVYMRVLTFGTSLVLLVQVVQRTGVTQRERPVPAHLNASI